MLVCSSQRAIIRDASRSAIDVTLRGEQVDDETAKTVMLPLEKHVITTSSMLPDSSFEITSEDDCGCHLCKTGRPGKDGYRPHTATSNCWCLDAEYYGCCEVGKQLGDDLTFASLNITQPATGHIVVRRYRGPSR
jgi:hypothetical protein